MKLFVAQRTKTVCRSKKSKKWKRKREAKRDAMRFCVESRTLLAYVLLANFSAYLALLFAKKSV